MAKQNKYWENEKGELVEFGKNFIRNFEQAGKVQFGKIFKNSLAQKSYIVKFVLDKKTLCESKEGLPYLREVLDEWAGDFENED